MQIIDVDKPGKGNGWRLVPHDFEDDDKANESEAGCVILITEGGEYTLTGKTDCNRVVVDRDLACDITLDNCHICLHNVNERIPLTLKARANVALRLSGDNMLTVSDEWGFALHAAYNNRLTIDGNGWLTLKGPDVAIYGCSLSHIIINSGQITAFGGEGIRCELLTINGGDIVVNKDIFCGKTLPDAPHESTFTINGGSITVGGRIDCHNNSMVINGGNINVNNKHRHSRSFNYPAIGSSHSNDKFCGPVTISGGHIKALGAIFGNPLTISGAETLVEADSINTSDFGGATVRLKKQ